METTGSSVEPTDETWNSIIGDVADEQTRRATLVRAAADLDRALALRPEYAETVLSVLASAAAQRPITSTTWDDVERVLVLALGSQPGRLVAWLVCNEFYSERIEELAPSLSPTAEAFVRNVMASYGRFLESAFYISSNALPHDWRLVTREIFREQPNGRYVLRFRIDKYNGDNVFIESQADGILSLARVLLAALNVIADSGGFTRDTSDFIDEAERLVRTLQSVEPGGDAGSDEGSLLVTPASSSSNGPGLVAR